MTYEEKLKTPRNLSVQDHLKGMKLKDISAAALAMKATQLTPPVDVIRETVLLQRGLRDGTIINIPDGDVGVLNSIDVVKKSASCGTLSASKILKEAQGEVFSEYIKSTKSSFASLYKMNDAVELILKHQRDFDNKKIGPVSEVYMANARSLVEAQKNINDLIKRRESELSELRCNTLIYKRQNASLWYKLVNWLSKSKDDFYRKSLNDAFAKSFENITKALQEEKASK